MSRDGFLTRWSRRKREAQDLPLEDALDEAAPTEAALGDASARESASASGDSAPSAAEPVLSEEELAALPPVESIEAGTDITGFLRKGVPSALRNAALRRAWSANPAVRDYLDPAREYAYDWNVPGGVPGDGPLPAGFDARALAERIMGKRETAQVDPAEPAHDVREDVQESQDPIASSEEPAVENEDDRRAESDPEGAVDTVAHAHEPATAPGVPASESEIAAVKNPSDRRDLPPRPRRHGRATPV